MGLRARAIISNLASCGHASSVCDGQGGGGCGVDWVGVRATPRHKRSPVSQVLTPYPSYPRRMGVGSGAAYRRPLGPPPMGPAVPGDWYGWILTQTGPFWPRLDVRLAHPAPTTVTRAVPSIRPSHTVRSVAGVEVLGCTRSKPKSCRDGVPLMHCHRLGYRRSTCGRRGCWT